MFEYLSMYATYGMLALQIAIGAIFLEHGHAKIVGKTTTKPYRVLGVVEMLAALCVMLSWYDRLAAVGLAIIMVGAIYFKIFRWKIPFTTMSNTGWEFDLILLASAFAIATRG